MEHLTLSGNIVYDVTDHLPNFLIIQKFTSSPINVKNCKQFGFCAKHSTDHAILSIIDLIQNAIDYQEFSCGIFLDFSKAFDIVNHNIMIEKLDYYGICGVTKDLFISYLTNRYQYVS